MSLREAVERALVWPLPRERRRASYPGPNAGPDDTADGTLDALEQEITDRGTALARVVGWLELVRSWNRKIDLTAAKDDDDLAELGVLDAVQIAARIARDGGGVVDVGSGFGAPGIPIAIFRPDLEVKLVEPLGKRASFLRTVIGSLGLTARVEVLESRGDQVADADIHFDAAISRATLSPAEWLQLGDRLAPRGEVVALLARDPPPDHPGRAVAFRVDYKTRGGAPRVAISYVPAHHLDDEGVMSL